MTRRCRRSSRGWTCIAEADHRYGCFAVPKWWNVRGQLWLLGWIS